jgi:hypothetical protein
VEKLGRILSMIDHSLNTKKRRHIAGGILMSISLLFGGLAVTVLSVKTEPNEEQNDSGEYELIYSE